ncbi:MAG: VOC family protein [Planctomycetota bacterium]
MHIGYAIVFVTNMAEATAFYRDVAALPLRFESPGWTEFATTGATLALHATKTPPMSRPAGLEPAGSVRIGWSVPDLDVYHAQLCDHKVPCLQEPKEQFGVRIAMYEGPDGLAFSVSEARSAEDT